MSVYGASFVQADADGPGRFGEICRLVRERTTSWLAASPTNLAVAHTVRLSDGAAWISIENAVDDELLETLSADLETTALTVYACDEIRLSFSYRRFACGRSMRSLGYEDDQRADRRGAWTRVEGDREPWEVLLFSERLKALYAKHAPDEVADACRDETIKFGHSIPWACAGETVAEIADRMGLPWRPVEHSFPPASRTEVIPGSPDRWKRFHRSFRKP